MNLYCMRFFTFGITAMLLFHAGPPAAPANLGDTPPAIDSQQGQTLSLSLEDLLHNFDWMQVSSNQPFLQRNRDASAFTARAGILDINRDGKREILLSLQYLPRGIHTVEVFAIEDNRMQSLGGFFEGSANSQGMHSVSYYKDSQDRLLFLQHPESNYGGTMKTLVATYLDDFHNTPIASIRSHYHADGTEIYYAYPLGEEIECTNEFLKGEFEDSKSVFSPSAPYHVTEEVYTRACKEFMDSLTWVGDISYDYVISYDMVYGWYFHEYAGHLRFEDLIRKGGFAEDALCRYQAAKEYNRTNRMVADALFAAYCTQES